MFVGELLLESPKVWAIFGYYKKTRFHLFVLALVLQALCLVALASTGMFCFPIYVWSFATPWKVKLQGGLDLVVSYLLLFFLYSYLPFLPSLLLLVLSPSEEELLLLSSMEWKELWSSSAWSKKRGERGEGAKGGGHTPQKRKRKKEEEKKGEKGRRRKKEGRGATNYYNLLE